MRKVIGPARWGHIAPHYFACYSLGTGELVWARRIKDDTPYKDIADLALFNGHIVTVTVDDDGGFTVEHVEVLDG